MNLPETICLSIDQFEHTEDDALAFAKATGLVTGIVKIETKSVEHTKHSDP